MKAHPQTAPLADLKNHLARLEYVLQSATNLEASPACTCQPHLLPILAALGDVVSTAGRALEPFIREESFRSIAGSHWRGHYGINASGEA